MWITIPVSSISPRGSVVARLILKVRRATNRSLLTINGMVKKPGFNVPLVKDGEAYWVERFSGCVMGWSRI